MIQSVDIVYFDRLKEAGWGAGTLDWHADIQVLVAVWPLPFIDANGSCKDPPGPDLSHIPHMLHRREFSHLGHRTGATAAQGHRNLPEFCRRGPALA